MIKKNEEGLDKPTKVTTSIKYSKGPFYRGQEVVVIKTVDVKLYLPTDEPLTPKEKEDYDKKLKKLTDLNNEIKKGDLTGFVYRQDGGVVMVDLKREYSFTSSVPPINLIFPDRKTFFYFEEKNLGGILNDEEDVNKDLADFAKLVKSNVYEEVEKSCEAINNSIQRISTIDRDISSYKQSIDNYVFEKIKVCSDVEERKASMLEKLNKQEKESDNVENYYNSIFKNKNVKKIECIEHRGELALLVETNDLEYTDKITHNIVDVSFNGLKMNIGSYVILFTKNGTIHAANKTKFVGQGTHHPCVDASSNVCAGSAFGDAIRRAITSKDYASAIHMTIDFLKEPNYGGPHLDAGHFYFAQERKSNFKTNYEYLFKGCSYGEEWDKDLFIKSVKEYKENKK